MHSPSEKKKITVGVPAHLVDAFQETVTTFFHHAHGGRTAAQKAAEVRASARDAGIDSLAILMKITERDSGQCGIIARFLAGLYNSTTFPFPLRDLRGLDEDLFEHCLAVLRLDNNPVNAIEAYFPNGDAVFQKMLADWGLVPKPLQQLKPDAEEYHAKYSSYGNAPGYRDMSLFLHVVQDGVQSERIEFRLSAVDVERIGRDIFDVQRFAWYESCGGRPIDAKADERPPRWIGPRLA